MIFCGSLSITKYLRISRAKLNEPHEIFVTISRAAFRLVGYTIIWNNPSNDQVEIWCNWNHCGDWALIFIPGWREIQSSMFFCLNFLTELSQNASSRKLAKLLQAAGSGFQKENNLSTHGKMCLEYLPQGLWVLAKQNGKGCTEMKWNYPKMD